MTILKRILIGVSLLVIGVGIAGAVLYTKQDMIPDLEAPETRDTAVAEAKYAPVVETVRDMLVGQRAGLSAPSMSVAVASGGRIVWAETVGYADIGTLAPATTQTRYLIGSVSKPITAALTMKLVEAGRLDLDRSIRDYLPSFPKKRHKITLRQLLSHQAGVRHYGFMFKPPLFSETLLNKQFDTLADSLTIFKDDALLFEPDTDFQYSTFGYTLISAVIEAATGERFEDLAAEYVFQPLQMANTAPDDTLNPQQNRATDYTAIFGNGTVSVAPDVNVSYKIAGGGFISTPSDLTMFGMALLGPDLFSKRSKEAMFTARKFTSGAVNPQRYGLGWRIGGLQMTEKGSEETYILPLIHHGGTSVGSVSILFLIPDYDIVIALTANTVGTSGGSSPLTRVAAQIAYAFLEFEQGLQATE